MTAAAIAAWGVLGTHTASATPPTPAPEPGGVIRFDLPPGEWWNCQGVSPQPPFLEYAPAYYVWAQGPAPIYLRFTPGAQVWVSCTGTGLPVIWYGPIVTAGQ